MVNWVDERSEKAVVEDPGPVKTGRYAGPVTRLLALAVDLLLVTSGFTLVVAGLAFLIRLFFPDFFLIPYAILCLFEERIMFPGAPHPS